MLGSPGRRHLTRRNIFLPEDSAAETS
jgi:hypothetical protein